MGEEIGPVQYLIVAFPGNRFTGQIAPALADLVEAGTIRIIDIAFVGKDENGEIGAFEIDDIDPEVRQGLENMGAQSGASSTRTTSKPRRRSSSPTPPRRCWLGGALGQGGRRSDAKRRRRAARLRPRPHEVVVAAREWARANA